MIALKLIFKVLQFKVCLLLTKFLQKPIPVYKSKMMSSRDNYQMYRSNCNHNQKLNNMNKN